MNNQRVAYLLELLLQRTEQEVSFAGLVFGPAYTPEMRRALELRRLKPERGRPLKQTPRSGMFESDAYSRYAPPQQLLGNPAPTDSQG
jgi:hypothetical protein